MRRAGRRAAFVTLGVVLLVLGLIGGVIAIWAGSSAQMLGEVGRLRQGQEAMELTRSALAESWFNLQRAANDPGAPLARELRRSAGDPTARPLTLPPLVHAFDLPGARDASITVEARVEWYRRLSPWPVDAQGDLRLGVRVVTRAGETRTLAETRAFRVQRIALPPPLDHWVLAPAAEGGLQVFGASTEDRTAIESPQAELNRTPAGDLLLQELSDPAVYRRAAAFEVSAAPGPAAVADWLSARMAAHGRANGIVFVSGGEGQPQRLSHLTLAGRLLIVATGPIALDDVTVVNRAEDLLNVVAYDAVELSGHVDANIVRVASAASSGTELALSSGTAEVTGSLLDLTGLEPQPFRGSLTANPHAVASRAEDTVDPAHVLVLFSPVRRTGPAGRGR